MADKPESSKSAAPPPADETPPIETKVEAEPEAIQESPAPTPDSPFDFDEPDDGEEFSAESDAGEDTDDEQGDADEISDDLLTRAVKAGMSLTDAREIGSESALERAVEVLERVGVNEDADAPEPVASEKEPFEIELDTEYVDEEVVGGFSQIAEEMNHLRSEIARLNKELAVKEESGAEVQFDNWIAQLGKEFTSELGDGATADLQPRTKAAKNRESIKDEMETIRAGLKARKKEMPSQQELFRRAVKIVIGDKQESVARKRVQDRMRNRQGQYTARPTNRNGRPLSPEAQATQSVRAFLSDRGITPEDDDQFE